MNDVLLRYGEGRGTNATQEYLQVFGVAKNLVEYVRTPVSAGAGALSRWYYYHRIETPKTGGIRLILTCRRGRKTRRGCERRETCVIEVGTSDLHGARSDRRECSSFSRASARRPLSAKPFGLRNRMSRCEAGGHARRRDPPFLAFCAGCICRDDADLIHFKAQLVDEHGSANRRVSPISTADREAKFRPSGVGR